MTDTFDEVLESINSGTTFLTTVSSDDDMNISYNDPYTTKQQKLRDEAVTDLLKSYVAAYKHKVKVNCWYKLIIFVGCIVIICSFSCIFKDCVISLLQKSETTDIKDSISLITVCLTFLTLVIGILQTITKYVFPENDEEYVTKIVEIIQNNDLENKKENIKAKDHS